MRTPNFVFRCPLSNNLTKKELGYWKANETTVPQSVLKTTNLSNLLKLKKEAGYEVCAVQRFNTDHRVAKDSDEYFMNFNGCVFIDIDYCKCSKQPIRPAELRNILINELKGSPCFLYLENSLHKNEQNELDNFHIIFYVEDNCSVLNYEFFYWYFHGIVKDILNQHNIDYNECLDDNVSNPLQLMFLTSNNYYYNEHVKAFADYSELFKWEAEHYKKQKETTETSIQQVVSPSDYFIGTHTKPQKEHLGYTQRWYLFANVAKVFSGDELKKQWARICNLMPIGKHSMEYYIEEPFKHDWVFTSANVKHVNNKLLGKYGIINQNRKHTNKILNNILKCIK